MTLPTFDPFTVTLLVVEGSDGPDTVINPRYGA